ncbi:MAG: hypothetical protein K6C33_08080 [Desulfovibrio sp.]|nr:hypothetical protein [Desulfovibrio sp.]
MATKISQRFIIDKIEQYETFPHHPKTMKLDINRKIYYEQLNIEYNDINKKSQIVDDGLKLNLFLNTIIRAEKILNIEIEIEEQRNTLEKIKLKKMTIDDEKVLNKIIITTI